MSARDKLGLSTMSLFDLFWYDFSKTLMIKVFKNRRINRECKQCTDVDNLSGENVELPRGSRISPMVLYRIQHNQVSIFLYRHEIIMGSNSSEALYSKTIDGFA